MKINLKPISLNESSNNVILLHKILDVFGLPVSKKELETNQAGESTLKQVRALQAKLNIKADEKLLFDEASSRAIAEEMDKRGLTSADNSFKISGSVKHLNGEIKKRCQLYVFDLDLRGVSIYRSLKNISELKKNVGFEYLGETVSDNKGNYSFIFYEWQYGQAERKKADIVVYAIEGENITGRSRMVNSEEYSDKGEVRKLDVFLRGRDERTEYEIVTDKIEKFLRESSTTLDEIAKSYDQLVFTSGELDIPLSKIQILISAEKLSKSQRQISRELLYGIGRQNIRLDWQSLYRKTDDELKSAITSSQDENIIRKHKDEEIRLFLDILHKTTPGNMLGGKNAGDETSLNKVLSYSLPDEKQRLSFLEALRKFDGDYSEFWNNYLPNQPEFKGKPELVKGLLFSQQLSLITGNHNALIGELQTNRKITSISQLMEMEQKDWNEILKKTGVPDFIQGENEEAKIENYSAVLKNILDAAFPTLRIASMVRKNEIPIEKNAVSRSIAAFLSNNENFDFKSSRIDDFEDQIKKAGGNEYKEVKSELKQIQRVYQVSPTTKAMSALIENKLNSANSISGIPLKSFIKTYSTALGGEKAAMDVHQRASYINARSESTAMYMMELSYGLSPAFVLSEKDYGAALTKLQNKIPNYSELFGSPDVCECDHCNSVYSAAAYFIDLLRFLWRSGTNSKGESPLIKLSKRRPDLLYLLLTCENTNTIIPYIDLANEIMEFYTANGSLTSFKGYDTGDSTEQELRANPQNFNLEAYRKTKDAVYPFTLPYHQPLDVIRTYSEHLKVSRYDVMDSMNPVPDAVTHKEILAEAVKLCEEEYIILTGEKFDGTQSVTALHSYYGVSSAQELAKLKNARKFITNSGIEYTELVELVETLFINRHQGRLDFLQNVFSDSNINSSSLYSKLEQIEAQTLNPANDAQIKAAIDSYNLNNTKPIAYNEFADWVKKHLDEFKSVITLYEPDSKCDLDTTELRTLKSIYENLQVSGITNNTWSKLHRFIRLWRKMGWSIHELDLMLAALSQEDIEHTTISKLAYVSLLNAQIKQPLNKLAVLWGNIDTCGDSSLYKKLFLNRAVQEIDEAFKENQWGEYLQDNTILLKDHVTAILAAYRITQEDLDAITSVAKVKNAGNLVLIDFEKDILNLPNLSTIYRYVVFAKALKMKIPDLCTLIALSNSSPFSVWNVQTGKFIDISPKETFDFYEFASSVKKAGFKAVTLEYIINGTLPADSNIGLSQDKIFQTVKNIRESFSTIEQEHPDEPETLMTSDLLSSKLSLTFQPDVVSVLTGIINNNASFSIVTDNNLPVAIPEELASKYAYVKGSGLLSCNGVMTGTEQNSLKSLAGVNANFQSAVDTIYAQPEGFIKDNFEGVFNDLTEAYKILLDHPAQLKASSLDEKLLYVYNKFLPLLKTKLRKDAITQHIASLIGLNQEAAGLLIAADLDSLVSTLPAEGHTGIYFSDASWNTKVLERIDGEINFDWGAGSPDTLVPPDNFSVSWESYISAPSSGEYTLIVDVEEDNEEFQLFLDEVLILEKKAIQTGTSFEIVVNLNAAQMHHFILKYSDTGQNAGIRLYWKTATSAPEILASSYVYPAGIISSFTQQAAIYHRAAKFISGFKLSETELNHFLTYSSDFGNINFKAITLKHWIRIRDYADLRNSVPQNLLLLTDVFASAGSTNPVPTVMDLASLLYLATAWDTTSIDYLVNTQFKLTPGDFKNEIVLKRIYSVMQIVTKTGLTAEMITTLGKTKTDFDTLNNTAQLVKNAVKAKYEEEDWLSIAGKLSDRIRENQKQALISYLKMRPELQSWGVTDADSLFEYFLIDVQMGSCMDTSRIVQANSSLQMFVNRCLLNLESDMSSGSEKGVSPDSIDKDRWEWMKNYRVWEANRKVFLYPENWLEPEWRNDRSEFFKELESYLLQNDITDRSVEAAFRNYLMSLSEVAHLVVCGVYEEDYSTGGLKYLHVFGRTNSSPYKYYYRTWDEYQKWSAWQKIPVDIRSIDDNENSGVHLIPVVWKERLFLFWPEFFQKQESPENSGQSVEDLSGENISTLKASWQWEIRLGWSEYVDGKWTPKGLSKETIYTVGETTYITTDPRYYWFSTSIDSDNVLSIRLMLSGFMIATYSFVMDDIDSKIRTDATESLLGFEYPWFLANFMTHEREDDKLNLKGKNYFQKKKDFCMPISNNLFNLDKLANPFFYFDKHRSYFIRPVDVRVLDTIKNPDKYSPVFPGIVDDSNFTKPDFPHVGPDDYMPGEWLNPSNISSMSQEFMARNFQTNSLQGRSFQYENFSKETKTLNTTAGSKEASATEAFGVIENQDYKVEKTNAAFGGLMEKNDYEVYWLGKMEKGLEFHTFYHPYSSQFVTNLNHDGMDGLMESDTKRKNGKLEYNDSGDTFVDKYKPNFSNGFITKAPSSNAYKPGKAYTYYKENVCFDVYGAYSIYNWELFFHAPLYIATRLSKNGKYEEAMKWFHYIFDPTTDEMPLQGQTETSRYWKTLPFKTTPAENLEEFFMSLGPNTNPNKENSDIAEWRDNPFDPHLIASKRPLAYMKNVVLKYVENLIAWGDSLFRQFTMESVNEALQVYVIANHILGPYPEFIPKRGDIKAESYDSLKTKWDDFSNAIVELENIFPYSSDAPTSNSSNGTNLLGIGSQLYFCIPNNEKLLEYWDTVGDRLFKIRHCMDIDGIERKLSLFAPPIDPALLVQATSQGLSLGSILASLSSPPPIYRFTHLIQKANEFCNDVKSLGSSLLAALEKKDAEELGRLRASHETTMLELITAIKERQVLEAKSNKENLLKARETASFRLQHYIDLLGNDSVTVPAPPTINATLTAESQLPADTGLSVIEADVDVSLVDSDESGIKLIPKEKEEFDRTDEAHDYQFAAGVTETIAGGLHLIPIFEAAGSPFGVGARVAWGGTFLGNAGNAVAKGLLTHAGNMTYESGKAAKMSALIRREQDWTLQANLASKEIIQLDKQITSADIRIQVTEKELENHKKQIENSKEVELFLKDKFTNQELYQWMKEQLFAVYKQSYNLAYDMAKKTEKAYKYETGKELASFIQYGYWDNSKQGLAAGEKLHLALRQLEKSYLEDNRRDLELRKSVSIATLNPTALIELRETGKCYLKLPEEIFDMDFQGHYFRKIKSVSLSLPCIAGPSTVVSCSLRLQKNVIRINTSLNDEGSYEHNNDEGVWTDDDRFRSSVVPFTSIAASTGQNDSGLFEFSFRDERYLPFEGAGVISEWLIELTTEKDLRQFDYSTISDVILHLSYSARENGGLFREKAIEYIKNFITNASELSNQPLMRMLSMKQEFSTEWYKFLHPVVQGGEQILSFTIGKERFPFFANSRNIQVMKIQAFAKCIQAGEYKMVLSYTNLDGEIVNSTEISMPQDDNYDGLNKATINVNSAGLNLEEMDINKLITVKVKKNNMNNYSSLSVNPDEVTDMFLVLHYFLYD